MQILDAHYKMYVVAARWGYMSSQKGDRTEEKSRKIGRPSEGRECKTKVEAKEQQKDEGYMEWFNSLDRAAGEFESRPGEADVQSSRESNEKGCQTGSVLEMRRTNEGRLTDQVQSDKGHHS